MTPADCDILQMNLCGESDAILEATGLHPSDAYAKMLDEPDRLLHWWDGAYEKHPEEAAFLDSVARAYARSEPLPEMTVEQRARFALRLRFGSRIIRAISSRQFVQPRGWFPNKLRKMSRRKLVEWVLVNDWLYCAEIFDEVLLWADEVKPPLAPSMKKPTQQLSGEETSSFSE